MPSVLVAADENVGGVPATVELLVTLVELSEAASFPEVSCTALVSLLLEGSEYETVTTSSFLTVFARVSSTVAPETVAAVMLLLEPPVVTAKAEFNAVVDDKDSLNLIPKVFPFEERYALSRMGAVPATIELLVTKLL